MTTNADKTREQFRIKMVEAEQADKVLFALEYLGLPAPRFVHSRNLYGSIAAICYGDPYRHTHEPLSWDTVSLLAAKLPGAPLTMVRDGCLSFRPTVYCDSKPEGEETPVCPLLCWVNALEGLQLRLGWYTNLPDIGVVSVNCEFPNVPPTLGTYHARRIDYRGGYRYARASFTVNSDQCGYVTRDGENIAEAQNPIIWSSGAPEYPNPVTIYWVDIHTDNLTTVADIVRTIRP